MDLVKNTLVNTYEMIGGHDHSLDVEESTVSYGSQDINDWHLCIVKKKEPENDRMGTKSIMDQIEARLKACNLITLLYESVQEDEYVLLVKIANDKAERFAHEQEYPVACEPEKLEILGKNMGRKFPGCKVCVEPPK